MTADQVKRAADAIAAEGTLVAPKVPTGLRRVPGGVDALATEHLVVNMGPQHPSTHGVLHILLELDGEEIIAAEASLGYLHRGIEKLAEHRRYHQIGTLLDRADYVSGFHTEWAYSMAVERLAEIEVPARAEWIRALMSELNRIASHLLWLGTFGMDTGAMGPFLYIMRDREALLDIFETVSGARMMFNYVRPGGVVMDFPLQAEPLIRAFLDTWDGYLDEYHDLLTGNEIFRPRVKGIGVIPRSTAVAFGMTGACLRGSGLPWDLRKTRPYGPYAELDFEVPLGTTGDNWDRYMVRMEEMRWAARLARQLLDGLPEGDFTAKVPKVLRPPAGEVYAAVESPRGELGVHILSDGSDVPYRLRLRSPALFNLSVVDEVLPGSLIADAVVTVGSLDIVLGEIDR
ncbi:MAG: NADH-quinone oxidoreductase subunit NuoD [Coriobacteriaceae bacterium]|nr:NADH-quinone oxidoreductase subunit NuoD [Coriobacteriaceae bacterium]